MPQIIVCEWRIIFSENLLHKNVYPVKDPWDGPSFQALLLQSANLLWPGGPRQTRVVMTKYWNGSSARVQPQSVASTHQLDLQQHFISFFSILILFTGSVLFLSIFTPKCILIFNRRGSYITYWLLCDIL